MLLKHRQPVKMPIVHFHKRQKYHEIQRLVKWNLTMGFCIRSINWKPLAQHFYAIIPTFKRVILDYFLQHSVF